MRISLNVLLLAEKQGACSNLSEFLGKRGCRCSLARSAGDALKDFEPNSFHVILDLHAAQREINESVVCKLGTENVSAFYCHPVEIGCWWLPLVLNGRRCSGVPALRPGEFVAILAVISAEAESLSPICTARGAAVGA